jgi:hypothetical protein
MCVVYSPKPARTPSTSSSVRPHALLLGAVCAGGGGGGYKRGKRWGGAGGQAARRRPASMCLPRLLRKSYFLELETRDTLFPGVDQHSHR